MKKVSYLLGVIFLVGTSVSCTKDYTCECTDIEIENGEVQDSDTYSFKIIDASKRQARFNCISEEEVFTSVNGNDQFKYERSCNLK